MSFIRCPNCTSFISDQSQQPCHKCGGTAHINGNTPQRPPVVESTYTNDSEGNQQRQPRNQRPTSSTGIIIGMAVAIIGLIAASFLWRWNNALLMIGIFVVFLIAGLIVLYIKQNEISEWFAEKLGENGKKIIAGVLVGIIAVVWGFVLLQERQAQAARARQEQQRQQAAQAERARQAAAERADWERRAALPVTLNGGHLMAATLEALDRAVRLQSQRDNVALLRLIDTGLVAWTPAGVVVDEFEVLSNRRRRFRARGEFLRFYTVPEALKP